ncbi:hypothetical protein FXV77_10570 [Sphingobacterium phlebotomi]|uniref:Uncharacterized protein n=1 Tax=Sphingobacterium phlebotomi TaxID=2605433 RepID=A0A5D4H7V3_9SPHI|nr:hypothetical protein [Sphingobacterium phlebotomi]TYR36343.1 hypothetical protein FXV77_10570 [Sphingobacterium phlebotomi]
MYVEIRYRWLAVDYLYAGARKFYIAPACTLLGFACQYQEAASFCSENRYTDMEVAYFYVEVRYLYAVAGFFEVEIAGFYVASGA